MSTYEHDVISNDSNVNEEDEYNDEDEDEIDVFDGIVVLSDEDTSGDEEEAGGEGEEIEIDHNTENENPNPEEGASPGWESLSFAERKEFRDRRNKAKRAKYDKDRAKMASNRLKLDGWDWGLTPRTITELTRVTVEKIIQVGDLFQTRQCAKLRVHELCNLGGWQPRFSDTEDQDEVGEKGITTAKTIISRANDANNIFW
ncbi:MAG: hypothetical protein ACREBR_02965 [bacterium]